MRLHAKAIALNSAGIALANQENGFTAQVQSGALQISTGCDTWDMSLVALGYGGMMQTVGAAQTTTDANRVDNNYGLIDEWFINGPNGLEQGFTVSPLPQSNAGGSLTVELTLGGDLTGKVNSSGDGLMLYRPDGSAALGYSGLAAHDATGKTLPATMQVQDDGGHEDLLIQVNDAGATGAITIDPFVQMAKLTASDGTANANFGRSVAVAGDTVVVGANGGAYLFTKPGLSWGNMTETCKLSNTDNASNFGWVAISSDGNTVVVGASGLWNAGYTGAAGYVYVKPTSGWTNMTQTAKLTPTDSAANNYFGQSVAISGNGSTVVIGAPGLMSLDQTHYEGAAYVFTEPATGWWNSTLNQPGAYNQAAKLTPSDYATCNEFGQSVAIDDFGNTVAVGAPWAGVTYGNVTNVSQGEAYVFTESGSKWTDMTESCKLIPTDGNGALYFAQSVAINGSGDTVLAGAPQATVGNETYQMQGAAYVFVNAFGSNWALGPKTSNETAKLSASDGMKLDDFGSAVAMSGNFVLVGAEEATFNQQLYAPGAGAAYLFTKPASGWANITETVKFTAADGYGAPNGNSTGDNFGDAVALNGDAAVIGADYAWLKGVKTGTAYVFDNLAIAVKSPANQIASAHHGQAFALGSFTTKGNVTGPFTVDVDWGDGTADSIFPVTVAGNIPVATHIYANVGKQTATVSVTDAINDISNTTTFTVTVAPSDTSIVVTPPANQTAAPALETSLALGSFTQANGTGPFTVDVNWGDGTSDGILPHVDPGTIPPLLPHTYVNAGNYTASITVTDSNYGTSNSPTFTVDVGSIWVGAGGSQCASVGQSMSFFPGSFTQTNAVGPFSVDLNWNDGSAHSQLSVATDGLIPTMPHTYATTGNYTVTVTVSDSAKLFTANAAFAVQVGYIAVTPGPNGNVTGGDDKWYHVGNLTQLTNTTGPYRADVNWGDSSTDTTFTVTTTGDLGTWYHKYTKYGNNTVTVTVMDSLGITSNSATFTVAVAYPPPSLGVLAKLSNDVYSNDLVPAGDPDDDYYYRVPSWDNNNPGYRANGYETPDGSQIVVAIRGTVFEPTIEGLKTVAADVSFGGSMPTPFLVNEVSNAAAFVASLAAANPNANITITGHSLGGAIAQLVGLAAGLPTYTFNAPGASQLFSHLSSSLSPVVGLGSAGTNVNYRIYGDPVSLCGTPIGTTITLAAPASVTFNTSYSWVDDPVDDFLANAKTYLDMHRMTTVLAQLGAPTVATGPNDIQPLMDVIQPSLNNFVFNKKWLALYGLSFVVTTAGARYVDPDSGTDFVVTGQAGSPQITAINLPVLANVASYNVSYESGGIWSASQSVQPGAVDTFSSPVDGVDFTPLDSTGQPVQLDSSFLFAATFASTGTFTGNMTVSNVIPSANLVVTPAENQGVLVGQSTSMALGNITQLGTAGPYNVDVNWGDGLADSTLVVASGGAIPATAHTYANIGNDTVTVTVSNPATNEISNPATFIVTVANIAATPPGNQTTTVGQSHSFSLGSFAVNANTTAPFKVDVNWGDGSSDSIIGNLGAGTIPATVHTYTSGGNDTVTLTVKDAGNNTSNNATFNVTVAPATPSFSHLSIPSSIHEGTAAVAFSGTIAAGAMIPPGSEVVAITLGNATYDAAINSQGNFSALINTSQLSASATPYSITYTYAGDASFSSISDNTSTTLLVTPGNGTLAPALSNLSVSSSVPNGTAAVTYSGMIASGTYIPPDSEAVAITLNGVTQNAAINSNGNFTTTFNISTLPASNTPYQISYTYAGDTSFNSVTDNTTTTLLVMPTNGTETPVYRLYSQVTKEHLYTADLNEYNTLGTRGWDQEGLAYDDYSGLITIGGVTAEPLYRLYNIPEQQHLWTTDPNEYNTLKNFVGTWSVDGISGYIFPANGNTSTSLGAVPGSAALYRMSWPFNPSADLHLWTTDLNEYNTDAATYGWTKEGVIGYVM